MNAVSFLLILFLLLSPLSVGFSYTLFGSLYGDDCLYHDVFCENLYINRPHLNLGLEFTSVTETRLKMVFDEFDNTIGEATVAENNNSYLKINNLSLMLPYRKILFGLRYTPL